MIIMIIMTANNNDYNNYNTKINIDHSRKSNKHN